MRGEWIIHENGVAKILKVAERFFESRRNYWAGQDHGHTIGSYRPWMSKRDLGWEILKGKVLEPNGRPFPDYNYLKEFCSIYYNSTNLTAFRDGEFSRPFADFYERIPGALAEHYFAYEFLASKSSWMSPLAKKLIQEIIPIAVDEGPCSGLGGISDPAVVGLIFIGKMTEPFARIKAVVAMAHELGHQALMILQTIENMSGKYRDAMVYSGVREVERPFLHSLHAAVALAYMIEAGDLILKYEPLQADAKSYLLSLQDQHRLALRRGYEALDGYDVAPICRQVLNDLKSLGLGTKR